MIERIGHYRLLRVLGEGGMGTVFLAEDERLHRRVAIKCLKDKDLSSTQRDIKRFRNEAKMQAKLSHPNIVHLYDVVDFEEQTALVMEYIDGENLSNYVRENNVSLRQKMIWLRQIALGLSAAHSSGLIHRDLKASNILIDNYGNARIADFGVAVSEHQPEEFTETDQVIGSYKAMSPEQALGLPMDARSDLFSFGVLAYRLLCGSHPFGSNEQRNVLIQNILHQPPVPANELNPHLDELCIDLLNRLLEKNPKDRPESALTVSQGLQACVDQCTNLDDVTECSETLIRSGARPEESYGIESQYFSGRSSSNPQKNRASTLINSNRFAQIRWSVIGVLICILCALIGRWYWLSNFMTDPLFVAILEPSLETSEEVKTSSLTDWQSMNARQQVLLKASLMDALQQYVLSTDNLHLINPGETAYAEGDLNKMAGQLGADAFLQSSIRCQGQFCDIEFNRLQQNQAGVDEPWALRTKQQWKVLDMGDLLTFRQTSTDRVSRLFPEYSFSETKGLAAQHHLSEQQYQQFLIWYHDVVMNGVRYEETLAELNNVRDDYQLYLPYYDLLQYICIKLFDDTQDVSYLQLLETELVKGNRLIPDQLLIQRARVKLYLRKNDETEVNAAYQSFVQLDPLEEEALVLRAKIEEHQGRFEEAIQLLQKAVRLRPSRGYLFDLALDQFLIGELNHAKASLQQLLRLSPDDYEGLQLKGHIATAEADFATAILTFEKASIINPQAQNFNGLGIAYMLANDLSAAETAFQLAIKHAPKKTSYLLNLADSHMLLGNQKEATELYQQILVIEQGKEDWSSLLTIAQANAHLGKATDAISAVRQSQRLAPDNSEVHFTAALVYSLSSEWASALVSIKQSLNQGMNPIWYSLPWFDELCLIKPDEFNLLITQEKNRCNVKPP